MRRWITGRLALSIAVTLFALALRAHHLDWGLPNVYEEATSVQKAWGFWSWGEEGCDFNPRFFNYPSLYFYLQFGVQAFLRAGGWATGALPDETAFRVAYLTRPGLFVLAGRSLTALLGAATVLLLFHAAWRLGRARVALPAALFLALHTVHIEKSRFVEVDVPMTFFLTLSLLLLVRYATGGRRRNLWLGAAAIGLATATKYPAALFLLQIPLAEAVRPGRFRIGRPLAALCIAVAAFAVASPYVFLDREGFLRDFRAESVHMRGGHFGAAGGGALGALRLFAAGFGRPLFLVSLAGLAAGLVRPSGVERLAAPLPLLLFLVLAASRMQAPHYPLPAVPFLALLAALFVDRIARRAGPGGGIVSSAAVFLLLVPPAIGYTAGEIRIGRGDTRGKAKEWIEKNVRAGSLVLLEPHGPQLDGALDRRRFAESDEYAPIRRPLLAALSSRPSYRVAVLPSFSIDVERSSRFYLFPPYQWFEYAVLSGAITGRYVKDPDAFPVQNEFYRALRERYRMERRFPAAGGTGPEIEVYRRRENPGDVLPIRFDPSSVGDQDFALFFRSVADLYRGRGLAHEAAALLQALLRVDRQDGGSLLLLAQIAAAEGEVDRAVRLAEEGVRVTPTDRVARMNLAIFLCQAGRSAEGITLFERLLKEEEEAEVHGNLGSALLQVGRRKEALFHFRAFLRLAPGHRRAPEVRSLVDMLTQEGEGE